MEKVKVHILYVRFWKFKNLKNATESTKKIYSLYGQSVNFQSFILTIHHWKMNLDQDAHQTLIKML